MPERRNTSGRGTSIPEGMSTRPWMSAPPSESDTDDQKVNGRMPLTRHPSMMLEDPKMEVGLRRIETKANKIMGMANKVIRIPPLPWCRYLAPWCGYDASGPQRNALRQDECKKEGTNVQDCIKKVKENTSEFNLTRLKTAISELAKVRNRVKGTGKEIKEQDLLRKAGNTEYATRCRRAQHKQVQEVDDKINEAQKFHVENKKKSPGDMRKMAMELKPQTQLTKESTLEDARFLEFLSFFIWNKGILKN